MLSTENQEGMKMNRRRCAVRTIGRAGVQSAGSRRRYALNSGVVYSSSAAPVKRLAAKRKPAIHRIHPKSYLHKDKQFDSWMAVSSDHMYFAKSSHRRSSLPMDYRSLAGMTPKWYAKVKEQRSVLKQQRRSVSNERETTNKLKLLEVASLGNELAVNQSHHMSESERSCGLGSNLPDYSGFVEASSVPVLVTQCGEAAMIIHAGGQIRSVKQQADKQIVCSVDNVRETEAGAVVLSDMHHTMYRSSVCRSSSCDCYCFSDSSTERETDALPINKVDVDGFVVNAIYIGCDGSCKVTCDLHLVGALETVSDSLELVTSVTDRQSVAENGEQEDFVDNVCIDCGCELTCDDMTECVYSVPICSVCSQDADDHSMPSIDDTVLVDHGYTCQSTDSPLRPSPQKEASLTPSVTYQLPEMPDVDVVDDLTFLSFPSKLLMHKYISCQQHSCEPAVRSSWMELARWEKSWHGGHKSHRSVWFGKMRHRHIDRFRAHNRLNEQIDLGLVTPLSANNSTDLLGIKLNTCLSQNKAVVGRKLKCSNRHVPNDSIQRPTRVAARDQYYCTTRFRRKGNALRTLADAEQVAVMKLTQQEAKEALEPLQVPSILTRNNCCKPGCGFGCICNLFASNRFASVIGAEFSASVIIPEFPIIDDSWRWSLLSSADTSLTSSADESLHQLNSSSLSLDMSVTASPVLSTPVNLNTPSCTTADDPSLCWDDDGADLSKRMAKTRSIGNVCDGTSVSPSVSFLHRRRRLKRRRSQMQPSAANGNDGEYGVPSQREQQKQNVSQTLASDGDSCVQPKRRRLKRSITQTPLSDSDDRAKTEVHKRRRRSSTVKTSSTPRTGKKKAEGATTVSAPSQEPVVNAARGKYMMARDMHMAGTVAGNAPRTNITVGNYPASHHGALCVRNTTTGKCYILQRVVKGSAHSSASAADMRAIATYPVQAGSKPADSARLVLPPDCRIGVLSASSNMRQTQASATTAAIPRLVHLPLSSSVSSPSNSSGNSSASPFLSPLLKLQSSSPASVAKSSPSGSSGVIPSRSTALTFTRSILKKTSPQNSVGVASRSNTMSNTASAFMQSILKHQEQPFRTSMILFQRKQDATSSRSDSGQTRLLEMSSNCDWDCVRPKVLAWLSDLTKNSEAYPQACTRSVGGFRVEVQPRSKQPTELPPHMQETLGVSTMFAIRVRITPESKLLPASRSVPLPLAAKSAALRLRDCNGLNVIGSVHRLSVDSAKQRTTNADVTEQSTDVDATHMNPGSLLALHGIRERMSIDVSRPKTNIDLSQESTGVDASHSLSENTNFSSTSCPVDGTGGLQTLFEPPLVVRTAEKDTSDHCGDCYNEGSGLGLNGHINTSSRACFDNTGDCAAMQQQTDAAVIKNDPGTISAKCIEVANSSDHEDDRNFRPSADSVNFPSSSGLTHPVGDCPEVACSLQADDGNFRSSPGLNVPIACPLDLRT